MRFTIRALLTIVPALAVLAGASRAQAGDTLYVVNTGDYSVTIYNPGKKADIKPKRQILGAKTELSNPQGVAVDKHGNVFVVGDVWPGIVTKYSPNKKGDATPSAEITGTTTLMEYPFGIALDSKDNVYVTNSDPYVNSVEEFAPLAPGNNDPAPTATIGGADTGLSVPEGIVVDSSNNIFVVNNFSQTVEEFASPAAGSNNVEPIASIGGGATDLNSPVGIALDRNGYIYVANSGNDSVTEYAPLAAGPLADAPPVATIAGSNTELDKPQGIAVDSHGYVYVSNSGSGLSSVCKFAPPVPGDNDTAPIVKIYGIKTLLNVPMLITLGK
ncbi:MAG: NHL repeat-containing protein [Candidatus Binatus sp.]|uniref:NHL repeat-containing protein n=1 Tax=Candidatus Binatus sp. TaxID=2811406 RepID=UPI003C7647C7